jgi:hypothetical protein
MLIRFILLWLLNFQACSAGYLDLYDTLCNLSFIEAKSSFGMAADLLEDFDLQTPKATKAQGREQIKLLESARTQSFLTFVSSNIHILSRFAQNIFPFQILHVFGLLGSPISACNKPSMITQRVQFTKMQRRKLVGAVYH